MAADDCYIVAPLASHTHTIILLHGRDSVAKEFADEFFESQASDGRTLPEIFPTIKWVFPSSGTRQSARFDTPMSQWFDIWSVENLSERPELQLQGLRESVLSIVDVLHKEASIISPECIFLGGISQGCATSIWTLLHSKVTLAGFIGFCGWLPRPEDISKGSQSQATRGNMSSSILGIEPTSPFDIDAQQKDPFATPVFLSHSEDDDVVPVGNGEQMFKALQQLGMRSTWKTYQDGGHWINEPQGVDDLVDFISMYMKR
ncbi:hypothetical protein M8818_001717 [Zalaria obscura]|uniref:Uncharacterized protein n=1 Tax=Zalaria obscura TaxID=2024903 RepID=A0ACC3SL66_9PEZI